MGIIISALPTSQGSKMMDLRDTNCDGFNGAMSLSSSYVEILTPQYLRMLFGNSVLADVVS